jgi:hypothetical protein
VASPSRRMSATCGSREPGGFRSGGTPDLLAGVGPDQSSMPSMFANGSDAPGRTDGARPGSPRMPARVRRAGKPGSRQATSGRTGVSSDRNTCAGDVKIRIHGIARNRRGSPSRQALAARDAGSLAARDGAGAEVAGAFPGDAPGVRTGSRRDRRRRHRPAVRRRAGGARRSSLRAGRRRRCAGHPRGGG